MTKPQPKNRIALLCFAISLFLFSTCSNDDGDNPSSLTASSGDDQNTLVGEAVTLNGSGSSDSEGNPIEYEWNFIDKPSSSSADISDANASIASFTPDVGGKYKIELVISNTTQNSDTLTVAAFDVENVAGTFDNLFPGPNVGIRDYTVCGDLIATCEFSEIGGIEAKKIAKYNGSVWSPLGCGLEDGSIYDMICYKGELYVTGQFDEIGCISANNIARWDGEKWHEVDGGITGGDNPFGDALEVYEGGLYVGGRFTTAGNVSVSNIARWDGENWSAVGTIEGGSVRALRVYKSKLYAGGFFESANGVEAVGIAVYDGSNWSGLGSTDNLQLKSVGAVKHLEVLKDILYIAGEFNANGNDVSELSTWNGNQLNDFGRAFSFYLNEIDELKTINDILYIGGEFNNVVATQANNFLQWDGEKWGIPGQGTSGALLAIEEYKGSVYLGGDFLSAGGNTAENISIWKEN